MTGWCDPADLRSDVFSCGTCQATARCLRDNRCASEPFTGRGPPSREEGRAREVGFPPLFPAIFSRKMQNLPHFFVHLNQK